MVFLKSCPKCRGDVYKSTDTYGSYTSCIQCSHFLTEPEEMQLNHVSLSWAMQPSTATREETVAA